MNEVVLATMETIGADLDQGIYPEVLTGGMLRPASSRQASPNAGKKSNDYVKQFTGPRQPAGPFQRGGQPARSFERRGQPSGSFERGRQGPPRPATPPFDFSLREAYLAQLTELKASYPGTRVWRLKAGLWLRFSAGIIHGQTTRAVFAVWLPFSSGEEVRAWAYWLDGPRIQLVTGRHVNPIDSSICAFEARDLTWVAGDSLLALFDLYLVWVFRHLAVRQNMSWWGYQSAFHAFERIVEFDDNDACGCNEPKGTYVNCCKTKDIAADRVELALDYLDRFKVLIKGKPDKALGRFIQGSDNPPAKLTNFDGFKVALVIDVRRTLAVALARQSP